MGHATIRVVARLIGLRRGKREHAEATATLSGVTGWLWLLRSRPSPEYWLPPGRYTRCGIHAFRFIGPTMTDNMKTWLVKVENTSGFNNIYIGNQGADSE